MNIQLKETPYNIKGVYEISGHVVEYRELFEAVQGGVELGELFIDGCRIDGAALFGGPPAFTNSSVYAPRFKRGGLFSKRGFEVCEISLSTKMINVVKPAGKFVWLRGVNDGKLFYTEMGADIEKTLVVRPVTPASSQKELH